MRRLRDAAVSAGGGSGGCGLCYPIALAAPTIRRPVRRPLLAAGIGVRGAGLTHHNAAAHGAAHLGSKNGGDGDYTVHEDLPQSTAFAGRHGLLALAMAAGLAGWLVSAKAQDTALSDPDKACLGCHGMEGMDKKAANGDSIPLHVPPDTFAKSVHTAVGCTGCHYDIKADAHPATPKNIASARAFSVETVQTCRNCHDDKFKEWENSIHAALVRDGNPAAPICSDCHSPHGVIKNAAAAMESVPCRGCHSDVYEAYAGSVHGKLRESGQIMAPLCAGCHTAHSITAANVAMELGLKSICTGCHADTFEKHKTWLPNAGLHLEVVSCAACHAPGVPRQVNLRLVDQCDAEADRRTERRAALRGRRPRP